MKRSKSAKRLSMTNRNPPPTSSPFLTNAPNTPPALRYGQEDSEHSAILGLNNPNFNFNAQSQSVDLLQTMPLPVLYQQGIEWSHTHISDITYTGHMLDPVVFTNYDSTPFVPPPFDDGKGKDKKLLKAKKTAAHNTPNQKISKKNLKPYYQTTPATMFAMSNFQARVLLSMAPEQLKEDLSRIFHDHSLKNYITNLNPNFVFHHTGLRNNAYAPQRLSLSRSESAESSQMMANYATAQSPKQTVGPSIALNPLKKKVFILLNN